MDVEGKGEGSIECYFRLGGWENEIFEFYLDIWNEIWNENEMKF